MVAGELRLAASERGRPARLREARAPKGRRQRAGRSPPGLGDDRAERWCLAQHPGLPTRGRIRCNHAVMELHLGAKRVRRGRRFF